MHFYLPKPLHGWREFVGEVGIIVVGVLIALGAEQIVEKLHWRAETRATRDALFSEISDNLSAAKFRAMQEPCVERRLNEIAIIFRRHAASQPIVLNGPIGRPMYYGTSRETWGVAVSSQAVAHMPLRQKLDFAYAFLIYDNMKDVQNREQDAWLRLNVLNDPQVLSEGDWPGLHTAYAEARALSSRLRLITNYAFSRASLGQVPSHAAETSSLIAAGRGFCLPVLPQK